jgi:hypothetical protein
MRKRPIIVVIAIVVCVAASVGRASADSSDIYKLFSSSDRTGVQSGIGDPTSAERNVVSGDVTLSSVWATNGLTGGSEEGIQQGVLDDHNFGWGGEPGTCANYAWNYFYFDETDSLNSYTCDYEGAVGTDAGSSHVQKVKKDSSGYWWGYVDGILMDPNLSKHWPAECGGTGNACGVYAFVEAKGGHGSCWDGKFSGSSSTPWQTYYSGGWHNAFPDGGVKGQHFTTNLDTLNWTFPNNNDPTSFWYFNYNDGNSCS